MQPYVVGLDLGTNSIGWAMLDLDTNQLPINLRTCGVRIFQEAVEAKTRTPKNAARRAARAARKLVSRRKQRREWLKHLLVSHGLLPQEFLEADESDHNRLGDPYVLRCHGLDAKLAPHEIGRVFLHLVKRRGFLSNRKTKGEDDGKVKSVISQLRQEMQESGARTLGEYLVSQPKKRERYTDRAMYEEEFDLIWREQSKYYPELLKAELKAKIHKAIFFQRPLKTQKFLIGKCPFETDRKRAARATLEAQRFRLLQDLNHLEIKNPVTRTYRRLRPEERSKLLALLEKQRTAGWSKAKSSLGLHENELFNMEEGKKTELIGDRTAYTMRKAAGTIWDELSAAQQRELVTDLLTVEHEAGFLRRLREHWRFDEETAQALLQTELEPGYARLSMKAIRKILPHLEKGLPYHEACKETGYDHTAKSETGALTKLDEPPYLRNPVVQKALYETRRVVNAIVRIYGKPALIRVEMARDMKLNKKQRDAIQKQNKANEKLNREAQEMAEAQGIQQPSRNDKIKYRLWKESGFMCPYTGKTISAEMLFSLEVEIEHIIPYSRCLDDSYMNKTLCMAEENRKVKHNRTPYEAYSGDSKRYGEILRRVENLPWPKRRKFEQKEVKTDDFISRQLNDTRYISVEVKNYLARLGVPVEVTKGEATATLRWQWNLDAILSPDGLLEKNRADHRHHAIDAVVTALTSRSLFVKLAKRYDPGFALPPSWQSLNTDVRVAITKIVVSYADTRKISGALHEDTGYGYSQTEKVFVYRKPLDDKFTLKQAEDIRDNKIKELVMQRLKAHDEDSKKAFATPLLHQDGETPITRVRLVTRLNKATTHALKDSDGREYKHFKYGNNHHVEIIEHIVTGKRKGIFVTAMEAARRARQLKVPVVQRKGPWFSDGEEYGPEWRFVMSLGINELAEVDIEDSKKLYRVQLFDASNGNVIFRLHTAATLDDKETRYQKAAHLLVCRKVSVDALGGLTLAND